jgi:hypothetical protein
VVALALAAIAVDGLPAWRGRRNGAAVMPF